MSSGRNQRTGASGKETAGITGSSNQRFPDSDSDLDDFEREFDESAVIGRHSRQPIGGGTGRGTIRVPVPSPAALSHPPSAAAHARSRGASPERPMSVASITFEATNANNDFKGSLEAIEADEQDLIQHIRTSGLRSPRETWLIDRVMDLRKARRRLCSTMLQDLTAKGVSVSAALQQASTASASERRLQQNVTELTTRLMQCEQETQRIQITHSEAMRAHKDKVKQKYREKLHELENKMRELESTKVSVSETVFQQRIDALKQKLSTEISEHYSEKLKRYKDALNDVVERETALRQQIQELAQQLERRDDRIRDTRIVADALKSENEALKSRVKDLEMMCNQFSSGAKNRDEEMNALRAAMQEAQSRHESTLRDMRLAHTTELLTVDAKVRRMIATRDDEAAKLRGELKAAVGHGKELEDALIGLHDGLA